MLISKSFNNKTKNAIFTPKLLARHTLLNFWKSRQLKTLILMAKNMFWMKIHFSVLYMLQVHLWSDSNSRSPILPDLTITSFWTCTAINFITFLLIQHSTAVALKYVKIRGPWCLGLLASNFKSCTKLVQKSEEFQDLRMRGTHHHVNQDYDDDWVWVALQGCWDQGGRGASAPHFC